MGYVIGDALTELKNLEPNTFNCVVTSPPYWGLRDYGTGRWTGGDPDCRHDSREGVCASCGARHVDFQLGLEQTLEEYLERMVEVFAEVHRVLRDDGTLWLNIGDSYIRSSTSGSRDSNRWPKQSCKLINPKRTNSPHGSLKIKDIAGVPWRLAFALQDYGWYLRQDIIWHKLNPMPESVRDRCCKSHEYIFLLTKNEQYHFDADAIKEPVTGTAHSRGSGVNPKARKSNTGVGWGYTEGKPKPRAKQNSSFSAAVSGLVDSRNKRSVWQVATHPYKGSHFATFPPELINPCILAGCPVGGKVLDPFLGSGTVGEVCERLGRDWFGIELNPDYESLIQERTAQIGLFNTER